MKFSSSYQPAKNGGNGKAKTVKPKKPPQDPPQDEDKILKDPYTISNVIEVVEYLTQCEVPTVVINTIVNEWNRRQMGIITRDEEKVLKEQFRVMCDFVANKGIFPEFYAYCEEHASGYLQVLDDKEFPLLRE